MNTTVSNGRRLLTAVALLMAFAGSDTHGQDLEARAKALFDQALRLQQAERYQAAIASYRQVLQLKPQSASSMNNLAKVYGELGDVSSALEYYRRAAEVGDDYQAFYQKQYADQLWASNQEQDAISAYRAMDARLPEAARARVTEFYLKGGAAQFDQLLDYLWQLVDAGEVLTAAETALTVLEKGGGGDRAADVLTIVAHALGQETVSLEQSEGVRARLVPFTSAPAVGAGVKQLLAAPSSPSGDFGWWAQRGNPWQDPQRGVWPRDAFRQLLRSLGARAERAELFDRAETYYFKAAELVPEELDPLAFQALCKLYMRQGNLDKLESIVGNSSYVDRLFGGKGEAYRRGQLDKIYEYHVTLGYIYGALARQNIIGWGDSNTPASAVFQLERARSVGETIDRNREAAGNRAPHVDVGVVELLAEYYGRNDASRATALRIEAGQRLLDGGSKSAALQVLSAVPAETLRQRDAALYRRMETQR